MKTQLNDLSARLSRTVAGIVSTSGTRVALVPLQNEPRLTDPAFLAVDGLHPNDAGHTLLADEFFAALGNPSNPPSKKTTKSNPSAPSS